MDWSCIPSDQVFQTYQVASLSCVPALFQTIFEWALELASIVAVLFIIWGGFKILRSDGDPKQVGEGRNTIVYAVIGLILVFSSYFILTLISRLTGIQCIKYFGFNACRAENTAPATP